MASREILSGIDRIAVLDTARTTFAAVAAMLLARFLKMPEYYWAPISTIVIIQSTIPPRTLAWQRFVGTAVGAVLGAALATFFHATHCLRDRDHSLRRVVVSLACGRCLPVCRNHIEYYFVDPAGERSVDRRLAPLPGGLSGYRGRAGGDNVWPLTKGKR